jgi:hypothetical protein
MASRCEKIEAELEQRDRALRELPGVRHLYHWIIGFN